jgi:alkylated DNA repair protein alkB family protein 1
LIASIIGFENYKPEAGIINYYHLNSTLSAHQDHSEKNMQAPLISISFGSSAIFLIGDTSKDIKPKAIWLKSGDIVIMSGKSRLSYHAVPKIFNDSKLKEYFEYDLNELKENFKQSDYYVNDEQWSLVYDYIKMNRINLNIRQVF